MFDYLYEWMRNLAFYMVLITTALHVVPNSDYKKYIRFFTGLVLILMLAAPILHLFGAKNDLSDLFHNTEYEEKIREMEEMTEYLYDVDAEYYLEKTEESAETDAEEENEKQSGIQVEEIRIGHEKDEEDKDTGRLQD